MTPCLCAFVSKKLDFEAADVFSASQDVADFFFAVQAALPDAGAEFLLVAPRVGRLDRGESIEGQKGIGAALQRARLVHLAASSRQKPTASVVAHPERELPLLIDGVPVDEIAGGDPEKEREPLDVLGLEEYAPFAELARATLSALGLTLESQPPPNPVHPPSVTDRVLAYRVSSRPPRSRFYDGRFYAMLLDPFLSGLHEIVAELVDPRSRVLDVGCGTGNLASMLAPSAVEVVGVELSPAMAEYATRRLDTDTSNVSILLGDVTEVVKDRPASYFDVATMVLVLHEMPPDAREPVLREVTRVAKRLVCLEYRVPMPWNLQGIRNRMAEALAGVAHFRAFRDFHRRGGTPGVAASAGLVYENVRYPDRGTFDVSVMTAARRAAR